MANLLREQGLSLQANAGQIEGNRLFAVEGVVEGRRLVRG